MTIPYPALRGGLRLLPCLLLPLLSGCCDCFDESIEHLRFKFDADSLGQGFRQAEVRSAYLIRYTDSKATQLLDTVRQPRRPPYAPSPDSPYFKVNYIPGAFINYGFRLNDDYRLASRQPVGSYRVVVPAAGVSYAITEIEVVTKSSGFPGMCQCRSIKRKNFLLDGKKTNLKKDEKEQTVLSR